MKTIAPAAMIVAAVLAPLGTAHAAPTETVLDSFGRGGGKGPAAGLIFDRAGNLYGTTYEGGNPACGGCGTVFKLAPPADGQTAWTETVLHRFKGPDGAGPAAGLIFDAAGNLYGTTHEGGNPACGGCGTVFELTPPAAGQSHWTETALHRFHGLGYGRRPSSGVIFDAAGNLFGTTSGGGASNGGTVFELTPPAAGQSAWTETVLYRFGGFGDGRQPSSGVIFDEAGNLFGATSGGGVSDAGTVFELTPPAAGEAAWTETVLYRFQGGTDGRQPSSGLIFDGAGNLYGTTARGGGGGCGCGTVFELTPSASGRNAWTETVLHSFRSYPRADGDYPEGGLIFDAAGNLYGTTYEGGNPACGGCGTVFELTPPAAGQTAWTETVLYSFDSGTDGGYPSAGLIFDAAGNLYGTTSSGGDLRACRGSGCGTVFEVTP